MGRRENKGQKVYAIVVIILGIAIIAMTVFLLFYVQKTEVSGNKYTQTQEIIKTVEKDKYSFNALYILWKYHFADYEMPGSLEEMKASLKNPWTVRIKVKEKKVLGYVYDDDGYVYFDKEGTVILRGTEFIEGVPCIEGIDISKAELYKPLKSDDKRLFLSILEVTKEVEKYQLVPDRIVCTDTGIDLYFEGVRVALGNEISTEKMAQIPPILERVAGRVGTLHLEQYEEGNGTISFTIEEEPQVNE